MKTVAVHCRSFQTQGLTLYGHSFIVEVHVGAFHSRSMKCFILCELILVHLTKETVNG